MIKTIDLTLNANSGQKTDFNDVLKAFGTNEIITTINNAQKYQDLVDNKVIVTKLSYEINNLKQQSIINELDKIAQVKDQLTKIANKIPEIKDGFDTSNSNETNLVKNSQEKIQAKDDKVLLKNHTIDISR